MNACESDPARRPRRESGLSSINEVLCSSQKYYDGYCATCFKHFLIFVVHFEHLHVPAGDNRELLEVEYLFYPQDLRAGLVGGTEDYDEEALAPEGL